MGREGGRTRRKKRRGNLNQDIFCEKKSILDKRGERMARS